MTFSSWPALVEAQREPFQLWLGRLQAASGQSEGLAVLQAAIQGLGGTVELLAAPEPGGLPCLLGRFGEEDQHPTVLVFQHLPVAAPDAMGLDAEGRPHAAAGLGAVVGAMLAAHAVRQQGLSLNLRFLLAPVGGDEAPDWDGFVAMHRERLACEHVVCPEALWADPQRPVLVGAVQGLLRIAFRLRTAKRATPAGRAGGYARNPLMELTDLLSACVDGRSGKVRIPGFYDEVQPLHPREVEGFATVGFDLPRFNAAHGLASGRTGNPALALSRLWALPTLELHGVVGGGLGPQQRLLVPEVAEAQLSCRLVAGMGVERTFALVRDFVRARNPEVVVDFLEGVPPLRTVVDGPLADAAIAAVDEAHGTAPVFVREGAAMPGLVALAQHLGVPVLLMPFAPEGPAGALGWAQARPGLVACASYFQQVAHLAAGPRVPFLREHPPGFDRVEVTIAEAIAPPASQPLRFG